MEGGKVPDFKLEGTNWKGKVESESTGRQSETLLGFGLFVRLLIIHSCAETKSINNIKTNF